MDNEKLIGSVEVRNGVELRAILTQYHGKDYLNVRLWEKWQGDGNWHPTAKGFTISAILKEEVRALMAKAVEAP